MDFLLYFLIKRVLAKYRPTVIGVFGDDEKEVVKEALYSLLYSKYKGEVVRSSANPDQSASAVWNTLLRLDKKSSVWSGVLKALSLLLFGGDYPRYVIIEYPINAPGKMSYFLEIVKPDIAILGAITDRNLEYFGSLEKEVAEKGKLLDALGKKDLLVLNLDNENTAKLRNKVGCNLITYGFAKDADVRASDLTVLQSKEQEAESDQRFLGVNFKAHYKGSSVPCFLYGVIGAEHARAVLASMPVAMGLGMNLLEIADYFKKAYRPARGRLNLIRGIKQTLIIDDSYSADPYSMGWALDTISALNVEPPREKYAVLGAMTHLGRYTEDEHREIGKQAAQCRIDYLYAVGEKARDILRGAREAGMAEDRCVYFATPEEAGKFLQNRLEKGDLLLVTGGYNTRMETIVRELMAEPLRADDLLVKK